MTEVVNLANGKRATYDMGARDAVITAYAQLTRGDYNWWSFGGTDHAEMIARYRENYAEKGGVVEGEKTIACGDWYALKVSEMEERTRR